MQRKTHKHPQKSQYWKRRHLIIYKLYHEFTNHKNHASHVNGGPNIDHKMLCINCRVAFKRIDDYGSCMTCGTKLIQIGQRVRVPRKLASDKVWNKFIKEFCNWKYLNRFVDENYDG